MKEIKGKKVIKEVVINGVKVKLEMSMEKAKNYPDKIESIIKIEEEEVSSIPSKSIFF